MSPLSNLREALGEGTHRVREACSPSVCSHLLTWVYFTPWIPCMMITGPCSCGRPGQDFPLTTALLLKGTRAVKKPPNASTATFPSGTAQLHVHSALGPHGWGRVTMATLQSSLSDSFTMYNRSVYRKNADRIFWFSSTLLY